MKTQNWKFRRLWYLLKYIGTIILLLAAVGLILTRFDSLFIVGRIILSLDIVLIAWMIMTMFDKVFRSKWGFAALFILILSLGVIVYSRQLQESVDRIASVSDVDTPIRYLYPLDNTLSVFFVSFGDYYLDYSTDVWYYVFHFLGYFFAAWVLFSLFGQKVMNRILCNVINSSKKAVFWGYSVSGKVLATDMMRQKEFCQPVFVLSKRPDYNKDTDFRIFNELTECGAVVVYQDLHGRASVSGRRHFFMTDNQDENVSAALRMVQAVQNGQMHLRHKIYLYVSTETEGIDALFQAQFKNDAALKNSIEMNIYSQSDITARSFVINHPILDLADRHFKPSDRRLVIHPESATVSGECNVLLLGLGVTGYELLRKTVCDAQFLGEDFHFSVTVIDDNFREKGGRYLRVFETARRNGIDIIVNPVSPLNSCDFYSWLAQNDNILNFDRIIVALDNDELNTNTAMQLHRFRLSHLSAYHAMDVKNMPEPIFVQVKDYRSHSFYKMNGSPIIPFGDFEEINSVDVLVREKLDQVAKMVNHVYCMYDFKELTDEQMHDTAAIESSWDANDTNIFNQNSSRSVALTVMNTVRIGGGIQAFRSRVRDSFFLERYSEMEHLRWNAFHIMCGVEEWPDDQVNNKKGKLLFDGTLARHICIVEYDALDRITDVVRDLGNVNEDYKESDRRIVRHFPMFYEIITAEKTL